jgi:Flp pilus assembly protein TadG
VRKGLHRLVADRKGGAAVEFGLLAPAFILMLMGVLQVGVAMQAYNSLRSASSDTAREVSVQYQTDNRLTEPQIAQLGTAKATTAPYLLNSDRLEVTVEMAATQQIPNATELTLNFTYQLPSFLDFAGVSMPEITYTRPIFVSQA